MPAALTWDAPSAFWDGSTWDAVQAPPPTTMNHAKAVIGFTKYTDAGLSPVAQAAHDKMTLNAATFDDPPITMADFQTLITTYDARLVARASRSKSDVLAFTEAREALDQALTALGNYVNTTAKGDPMVVDKSGLPSYETNRVIDTTPPAPPANLRLTQGEVSGSFTARYKPERRPSANEVQTNTGDPNNAADWHSAGMFASGRAQLDGYTPGVMVWVRVRTMGLRGVMGDWSDPAHIRVI